MVYIFLFLGFSTGQIQLIDPVKKELSKLFNEERLIDKSKVTCLRWVPGSRSLFLAAHASGNSLSKMCPFSVSYIFHYFRSVLCLQ